MNITIFFFLILYGFMVSCDFEESTHYKTVLVSKFAVTNHHN